MLSPASQLQSLMNWYGSFVTCLRDHFKVNLAFQIINILNLSFTSVEEIQNFKKFVNPYFTDWLIDMLLVSRSGLVEENAFEVLH